MEPTADEIMALLGLKPHPTCGFTAVTYQSPLTIPAQALPPAFTDARRLGTVMYFLVTATAHIAMHRIRSDQMYHHYLGDPLEVLLLYPDGTGELRVVGGDLRAGMRPQLFIPGGTFHVSRDAPGPGERVGYSLLGTSEWVGVEPADVEAGDRDRLVARYPEMAEAIVAFMGGQVPGSG
jgi:uncharacterized protein